MLGERGMFTEGLDGSAIRWISEKDTPFLQTSLRTRIDPITSNRNIRGFGLPPASKFRSGHLPSTAIPVSRTLSGESCDSKSLSDNDITTESDKEDTFDSRRSSLTSPQRYDDVNERIKHCVSDFGSSDFSSSKEPVLRRRHIAPERLARINTRHVHIEDEDSSSDASSPAFPAQNRNVGVSGCSTTGLPKSTTESTASIKEFEQKNPNGTFCNTDIPSAPPLTGCNQNDKEDISPKTISVTEPDGTKNKNPNVFARDTSGADATTASNQFRLPTFHASALGLWHTIIAYDGCVRVCLHAWARGCMEAPVFLENECALLRDAFGIQHVLLQSEEELLSHRSTEIPAEGIAPKPKKSIGKMKVQVRRVKSLLDPSARCSFKSLNASQQQIEEKISCLQMSFSNAWQAFRKIRVSPRVPANASFSSRSLAYVQASTQYIKQVSGILKVSASSLRNSSSHEKAQETYSCLLRLKSSTEEDAIRMQPGSGETHIFFPDSLGDDLIVEIQDTKGSNYGRVVAQIATIAESPVERLRWWSMYSEPKHELVGKVQLYINYSTSSEDNSKCGSVAETVAYDIVLEAAMKVQHFQQRNLVLYGSWKWLLTEFSSCYGVSDVYTKLRYLSYVMDVATPTADCLTLVLDLLVPVMLKGDSKSVLSHQENRILGEIKDQIEQILATVFENYKSLDESSISGISDVFKPSSGVAAPALVPAVNLYTLLHDILLPEAQANMTHYFQAAAKKRSRRHLSETDEYVANNNEANIMDPVIAYTAYQKMATLCGNIKNEISCDIEIHNQHILPSFIDLPNLSSSIYSSDLCSRLRGFLHSFPPSGPSPSVTELVIATSDFQRDLSSWNISPVKGGVDVKELFNSYIMIWIQDKRLSLLEQCKLDKVKWSGVRTQHSTTPFVDEMYERLKETLEDYDVIIRRWPDYIFILENAIADVEKAIVESLDKQYADVLAPLRESLTPKRFGIKYVKKLAKRSACSYTVPDELGILLNSIRRMLDVLRPKIESQFKSWGSCLADGGNAVPGDRLSEVTVMLRAKFRSYVQAVVERLAGNAKLQGATKLKKIMRESKESMVESDMRTTIQPLKDQLTNTINHLHTVFETHVFIAICRGYWDRMGLDVLSFLEDRKENRTWYKCSQIAVTVLDDTFASQMQQLLGNALQQKDVEPPRSITEVRSMLCRDTSF